ncbi:hypothetical protein Trco_001309 [Trichoderma cornu-damae]|uniref:Uncharacterized protein n=1 Tax=Trichoderma cornu-damae TaxID=654480 RepID=A0A9P8U153_9HYPO|nr:hypothetical protein Trco_001309 [Trichoderma cornu-damae]
MGAVFRVAQVVLEIRICHSIYRNHYRWEVKVVPQASVVVTKEAKIDLCSFRPTITLPKLINCLLQGPPHWRNWSVGTIVLNQTNSQALTGLEISPWQRDDITIILPCVRLHDRLEKESAVSERGCHGPNTRPHSIRAWFGKIARTTMRDQTCTRSHPINPVTKGRQADASADVGTNSKNASSKSKQGTLTTCAATRSYGGIPGVERPSKHIVVAVSGHD